MNKEEWLDGLKAAFKKRAPNIGKLTIPYLYKNDHVAFRTLGIAPFNIEILEKSLFSLGYCQMDNYVFKEKKLLAKSFICPGFKPCERIFISEPYYDDEDLKYNIRTILNLVVEEQFYYPSIFFNYDLFKGFHSEYYFKTKEKSEYISWVLANGAGPNHFTLSLTDTGIPLEYALKMSERQGFKINESGGRIKGKGTDLEQGSTMADKILSNNFTDGPIEIPTCFYEFAKRRNGFDGFVTENADKIFESTNVKG